MVSRIVVIAAWAGLTSSSTLAQVSQPATSTIPAPLATPSAPAGARTLPSAVEAGRSSLYLSATYAAGDATPIVGGLRWRIYREEAEPDGSHKLVADSAEAAPLLILPDGSYVVHVAFGLAGATRRVDLRGQSASERLALNAGGLRIIPMLGDTALPAGRASFSIYVPERNNAEGRVVATAVKPGDLVCLPEGTYHIVSTLADTSTGTVATPTNSVVTADLRVQAAKITEGTLRHRAALMTLKLVNNAGGEALANTAFTVLTPGGDVIRELIGAFPSMVLAEGEYVAIARHDGKTYQSVFQVQSTLDRDVEIKTK